MNWSGKRVLLTGHTGFKGSWLSLWLQQKGAALCGIALEPAKERSMFEDAKVGCGMRSVIGDTRDLELLKKTFAEHRPEIVFHLAALILIPYSYRAPDSFVDTNVRGTLNLCQAALDNGIERLIHTSTSEVYGTAQYLPIDENHPLQAQSPYSASKAAPADAENTE